MLHLVDFGAPFNPSKKSASSSKSSCDEGSISMIEGMGFTRQQAIAALEATVRSCDPLIISLYKHHVIQSNNMERAVDWIFSHADEVAAMETDQASSNTPKFNDGTGSEKR